MLTLTLLRHAKSSWDDPALTDHARGLSPRGRQAAPRMGTWIAANVGRPDLILVSDAVRTRATLDLVLPAFGEPPPPVSVEARLYHASDFDLLDRLRAIGREPTHVLVIGHNPGLEALAGHLAGQGEAAALRALAQKFPTAAVAVITFAVHSWDEIQAAGGRLSHFVTPKMLD